jgi:hypothetical protein
MDFVYVCTYLESFGLSCFQNLDIKVSMCVEIGSFPGQLDFQVGRQLSWRLCQLKEVIRICRSIYEILVTNY